MKLQTQIKTNALWTKQDVMKRLNQSQRTIDYRIAKGELAFVKLGRSIRFLAEDVEAFIQKHRIGGGK